MNKILIVEDDEHIREMVLYTRGHSRCGNLR